jgi:predicted transcriptional regulator
MTTTLKLSPELKTRVARVAKDAGQTPHAFMVEAIAERTDLAEKRRTFVADALREKEEFERTGLGYAMEEVHAYYRARIQGKKAPKPRLRQWRK